MPDYVENYQEIIESGRLEQYALGELDPAAQAEVEAQARRFPEVRQELDEKWPPGAPTGSPRQ